MTSSPSLMSEVGEKALIRDFIKPFFNSSDDPSGVGDDCAMVPFGEEVALFSTDRVPSDLTGFRLGILDFFGLGDYLARLNLSDIAACGGKAVGLLLNLGLPADMPYESVLSLCRGFGARATMHGVAVLGGDITSACELSISATSIGTAPRMNVLTRRGALPGDSIFISRPLGLTPAAFIVFLADKCSSLSPGSVALLKRQFTDMEPMLALGQRLGSSQECGACMDNTDGIGQSLSELSAASKCAFIVDRSCLQIPTVVKEVGQIACKEPEDFVFNGGADFSLVGTLRGDWSSDRATAAFGHPLEIIGRVELGEGLWMENGGRKALDFQGWNYFQSLSSHDRGILP